MARLSWSAWSDLGRGHRCWRSSSIQGEQPGRQRVRAVVGWRGSRTHTQFGGPGRIDTPRRDGAYYEDQLQQALRSGRKILAIETWNELGEGSGILETLEFGRQYIDLTRRYVELFKRGSL